MVWELDATTVGVAVISGDEEAADDDDVSVRQVARMTGFADQSVIDTITRTGVGIENFELSP